MRALVVLLAVWSATALHVPKLPLKLVRKAQAACVGVALCSSAALAIPTPATAITRAEELGYVQAQFEGTDPEAVIEVTAAAYPIIANLKEKTFTPFVTKVAELIIKDRGAKYTADLAKSVDLGLDWFLSLSPEKVKDSTGAVKDAFKVYDPNETGAVDMALVCEFFQNLGFGDISEEDANLIKDMADADGDGKIGLDDFRLMVPFGKSSGGK